MKIVYLFTATMALAILVAFFIDSNNIVEISIRLFIPAILLISIVSGVLEIVKSINKRKSK